MRARLPLAPAAPLLILLAACAAAVPKVDATESGVGLEGADGADGSDGTDGGDGTDGADGTGGTDGADGTDGTDGADGTDGTDGADGTEPATSPYEGTYVGGVQFLVDDPWSGDTWPLCEADQRWAVNADGRVEEAYTCAGRGGGGWDYEINLTLDLLIDSADGDVTGSANASADRWFDSDCEVDGAVDGDELAFSCVIEVPFGGGPPAEVRVEGWGAR